MIPEQLRPPLIDFVSRAEEIPNLRVAVIFGSAIKGDFNKKSDIDLLLLFDTDHNPEVGEEGRVAHELASEILTMHDIPHSFAFVMENLNDPRLDPQFLRTVADEGVVIWARPELAILKEPNPNMQPMVVFSYSLRSLKPREKMAVYRGLYGYRVEKVVKGKRYVNETTGIVGKKGKLGDGVLMVRSALSEKIVDLFERYGVKYTRSDVWI